MEREELSHWLRLTLTPGVGNQTARKLLAAFGLPGQVLEQPSQALAQVAGAAQVQALQSLPQELPALLETTWRWLQESGTGAAQRQIVTLGDASYPRALLELEDPPLILYLLGTPTPEAAPALAIVGSRNPSPQGESNARQFARALGERGFTIISGMALGVDAAAHLGALESLETHNRPVATVAVVGTGVDRVYPRAHRALAHRIAEHGCLLSEYPLGTPPLPNNFPRRNRLIAALARGTLVVEAALKSGSLITARLSAEIGREVFAIPGSIHAAQSRGCHALIRQGAKLVESAQDILEELRLDQTGSAIESVARHALLTGTTGDFCEKDAVLEALGFDPVGLDALQARCELATPQLQALLMALELEGQVGRLPGGLFQRQSRP